MKKKKATTKRKAKSQPKSKSKAVVKKKAKQSSHKPRSKVASTKKRSAKKQSQKPRRKSVRPLKEYEVEVRGMRIEYTVITVSESDKTRLRKDGIPVDSLAPYSFAEAFDTGSDTAWIADTVSAATDNRKVRVTRGKKIQYREDYRKSDRDVIFAWIETDEYATAQVNANRVKDIALNLSKPFRLSLPDHEYVLSEDIAVVSPSESDVEYTGGGGGNYELMYIQKGGDKLDLILDRDSDPQHTILRLE